MKLLYFQGGPGLNSNPEQHLLTKPFSDAGFKLNCWMDPSALRPNGYPYKKDASFQNYLDGGEAFFLSHYESSPLTLIAYCFSCHLVNYLAVKHPEKIKRIFIITPDYCLDQTDKNIITFIKDDYTENGNIEIANQMELILEKYTGRFDENTEAGFRFAAQNPRLFDYYWRDKYWMQQFLQYYTPPEYGVDVEGFFEVRRSKFNNELHNCEIPTVAIYGRHDKVISINDEIKNLPKLFSNLEIIEIQEASHYPHVERMEEVLGLIKTYCGVGEAVEVS